MSRSLLPAGLALSLLLVAFVWAGCDSNASDGGGSSGSIISPNTSQVKFSIPEDSSATTTLTLSYRGLSERPRPDQVPDHYTVEVGEETGSPGDGTSTFDVTFAAPSEAGSYTAPIIFRAGSVAATVQLAGTASKGPQLVADFEDGVDGFTAFSGPGISAEDGQLRIDAQNAGGSGVYPGITKAFDAPLSFEATPVVAARIKASAASDGPAVLRAALNGAGDNPDANSGDPAIIKTIPADGAYHTYYFDFRNLFVQYDGAPVDPTQIGELVFLINDNNPDTFTGTIYLDEVTRRPSIPEGTGGDVNEAPSAAFSYTPEQPTAGEEIAFTDESTDADGAIASREWTFGDDASETGATPAHTYDAAGSYDVTLTVTDDAGATGQTTQTIDVGSSGEGGARGDDDGDGVVVFDDFEDGLQENEYFTFSGGGSGIGLSTVEDAPAESEGSTALQASFTGTEGGFAGFGKSDAVTLADLGDDPYVNFYVRTSASTSFPLEINVQEDQDGNGAFDGSGAVDDEFQYNYTVEPGSGYTLVSIPLSDFSDDNSTNDGGDGALSSRILSIVFAVGGGNLPVESFTLSLDDLAFSAEALGGDAGATNYELVFEDNFDSFDDEIWDRTDHTFGGNSAYFSPENVTYEDGKMILTLEDRPTGGKPYTGGELSTNLDGGEYRYGRFEVRMKAAAGSGVVSSFFTYRYNPWQEIDIEFLGNNTGEMSTNIYYNPGPAGASNNEPHQVSPFPETIALPEDAAEAFHEYAFEWEPGALRWYVDGELVQSAQTAGAPSSQVPDLPMRILMNLWEANTGFAGPIDESVLPVQAEYDYVRLYQRAGE